jgi:hypothetical protein
VHTAVAFSDSGVSVASGIVVNPEAPADHFLVVYQDCRWIEEHRRQRHRLR